MTTTVGETSKVLSSREAWERERLLEALDAYKRGMADAPTVQRFAVSHALTPNENRPLTFVASDESEDRFGDVVRAGGWELDAYKRNPVFLWAHDYTRTPIGRSSWVGVEDARLLATVEFAPTAFAREVETLYRQRFLRAVSVGFKAKAFSFRKGRSGAPEGVEYTKQELVEMIAVPVPANPWALAKALERGLEVPRMRSLFGGGSEITPDEADVVIARLRGLRAALADRP